MSGMTRREWGLTVTMLNILVAQLRAKGAKVRVKRIGTWESEFGVRHYFLKCRWPKG